MRLSSKKSVGVAWDLTTAAPGVTVDGKQWPIGDSNIQWLPPGAHTIQSSPQAPPLRILDLNANLLDANATSNGVEFIYESSSRAMAVIDGAATRMEIDGVATRMEGVPPLTGASFPNQPHTNQVLLLPPGQHLISLSH